MSETVKNRSEILFLYDTTDANPNGDPLDENKPRIDDETGYNLVTDVRLKRTIRDYIADYENAAIFIKEEKTEDGEQKSRTRRIGEFLASNPDQFEEWDVSIDDLPESDSDIEKAIKKSVNIVDLEKAILGSFVDLRLFGATIAVTNSTITKIGPVQFKFGRSLHEVDPKYIQGTTVMPSQSGRRQGTITGMHILPYSLISFYGVVNENAAKDTGLTEDDVDLLLRGMWNGTKNLLTRSKAGQEPRLLLKVDYKDDNFHIGGLNRLVEITSDKNDKELRSVNDFNLDVSELLSTLEDNAGRIQEVKFKVDSALSLSRNGAAVELGNALGEAGINATEISF